MEGFLFLAGSFVVILALLALNGRRRERAALRDWDLVLTPKGGRELARARDRTDAELALIDFSYGSARRLYDEGSTAEALAMLDHGCRLIETYCPTMFRMLAAMSVLSRMVAAMGPIRPLPPTRFKLRQMMQLAYMNTFVHYFLVTTGERFRLRVYTLQRGFLLMSRVALRTLRLARLAPAAPWEDVDALREDTRALTDESMESFRALLMALSAERR